MTTNYERIKNMTVEEMAKLLRNCDDCYRICKMADKCDLLNKCFECEKGIKQWLQLESEEK